MIPNPAQEAVVRVAIEQNGRVYPSAVEDVLEQFRAGRFKATDAASFLEKIETEEVGLCPAKPHWFIPKAGSDDDLARQAFLFGHATSQSLYVRKFGREAANEAAARYSNPFANGVYGKPGVEPETEKALRNGGSNKDTNPWSSANVGPDGRYTARALTLQGNLVRAIGLAKANAIAAAVGARVGDVRPRAA